MPPTSRRRTRLSKALKSPSPKKAPTRPINQATSRKRTSRRSKSASPEVEPTIRPTNTSLPIAKSKKKLQSVASPSITPSIAPVPEPVNDTSTDVSASTSTNTNTNAAAAATATATAIATTTAPPTAIGTITPVTKIANTTPVPIRTTPASIADLNSSPIKEKSDRQETSELGKRKKVDSKEKRKSVLFSDDLILELPSTPPEKFATPKRSILKSRDLNVRDGFTNINENKLYSQNHSNHSSHINHINHNGHNGHSNYSNDNTSTLNSTIENAKTFNFWSPGSIVQLSPNAKELPS